MLEGSREHGQWYWWWEKALYRTWKESPLHFLHFQKVCSNLLTLFQPRKDESIYPYFFCYKNSKLLFTAMGPYVNRTHCSTDHINLQRAAIRHMIRNIQIMPIILMSLGPYEPEKGGYGWGCVRLSQATENKQLTTLLSSTLFEIS